MPNQENIERFEQLMYAVKRDGIDKLMEYVRKSDFYTAPASSKFHLACEGGRLCIELHFPELPPESK